MSISDWVILQVNTAGMKEKREKYGARLTFNNRNKDIFALGAEDDLNELMGNNPQVTHPDIPAKFPGVLLESNYDGPTAAVEPPVVDNNSSYARAAANVGIQHREDDLEGEQPLPLIMDYKSSDDDDNNDDNGNSARVNFMPVTPPINLTVNEPSQALDSNKYS